MPDKLAIHGVSVHGDCHAFRSEARENWAVPILFGTKIAILRTFMTGRLAIVVLGPFTALSA